MKISDFSWKVSIPVLIAVFVLSPGIAQAKISLSAKPKLIAFGRSARLSGRLTDNLGRGLAGKKIQIKVHGKVIETLTTKGGGVFKVRVKPAKRTAYKAVFAGDSSSATVRIKTPEQYVTDYFNAYKDQHLSKAFDMQPPENKARQPKADYVALRKSMPLSEFKLQPTEKQGDNILVVPVEYHIGIYGTWISRWEFEKNDDQWAAKRYTVSPSNN